MEETFNQMEASYLKGLQQETERLKNILKEQYESKSSNKKLAYNSFLLDLSSEFEVKYNSAGDAFALVRFEKYLLKQLITFDLISFQENFLIAKESFVKSWQNDSRASLIEAFFAQNETTIAFEIGKYIAWMNLGFESLNKESIILDEVEEIVLDLVEKLDKVDVSIRSTPSCFVITTPSCTESFSQTFGEL